MPREPREVIMKRMQEFADGLAAGLAEKFYERVDDQGNVEFVRERDNVVVGALSREERARRAAAGKNVGATLKGTSDKP